MYRVEMYGRVRRAVHVEGMSIREAAGVLGLHRDTVRKMLEYSVPPGYRRQRPPQRPKLDPYKGMIDQILEVDRGVPKKQRHTAKRIYERLRDEHGFPGKYTIIKDYVRERRRQTREMFVPLSHSPGHAQCDHGEARVIIGGVERKVHYFAMDLPHSDACYVKAYPAETTESFCDGHVSAFAFLGGAPLSIVYDNTTLAVAKILGDGRRQRTRGFSELQSHYLFEDRFGRPGKGNDKGKVEGMVGYVRRNFLVPIPSFESFEALNAHLEAQCLKRFEARLRGHSDTIGERLERDLEALLPLPAVPYDASDKHPTRVSSLSVVRYHTNDYSVPVAYGHRDVVVRGYVHEVVISCGAEVIARHRRSYERDDFVLAIPSLNKALVLELPRCEYIDRNDNVIALGNSGTGKTHVALGLGLAACQRGMSVGFTTAAALVHELIEARDERRLLNMQRKLLRLKLLIVDELGFVPLSKTGAELLFEVFSQRYERGSVLVTSNLPFDEWTEVFGSERLTGALLDRLTHHVNILEMNGQSYRLKQSRQAGTLPLQDDGLQDS